MAIKKNIKHRDAPVVIDDKLDKYVDMPLFQKKLDKANNIIDKIGLPKKFKKTA